MVSYYKFIREASRVGVGRVHQNTTTTQQDKNTQETVLVFGVRGGCEKEGCVHKKGWRETRLRYVPYKGIST
jgi:hypothetical protein